MFNTHNKIKFIYDKPKKYNIALIGYLIIIFVVVIFVSTSRVYSKLNLKAIEYNEKLVVTSSIDNIQIITKSDYYKINNKNVSTQVLEYSDVYNDGTINLQDITLKSISSIKENQIVDITFYYDKDLIIKKILKGVFK